MKNVPAKVAFNISKVKDIAPELDDVRTIAISDHEQPTPYDLTLIEGMASHFLPATEICAIIRMTRSRFEKHLEFQQAYQRGQELAKSTLRRMMYVSAKTNPTMQIWLSKQHLGMSDRPEAEQGESQSDAYTGFLNKLSIVINLPAEGRSAPTVIGTGKGDSEILLETVGENSATPTEPRRVVSAPKDEIVDSGVGTKQSGQSFHRLVEDMVISSGSGKR
jgi:hypothetical protein